MNASPALQSWQEAFDAKPREDAQRRAFESFLALGLPTQKIDAWKYTDLRRLTLKRFTLAADDRNAELPALLPFSNAIVFVNGILRTPTTAAKDTYSISKIDGSPSDVSDGAFGLLNAALSPAHWRIDISAGTKLATPLYVVHAWTSGTSNTMTHPRLTLRLGRDSQASVIEHHVASTADSNLTNSLIDIELGERANLEHTRILDDAGNFNVNRTRVTVSAAAEYVNRLYTLEAGLSRTELDVHLIGQEARAELHGLVFARDSQHLDVRTCIEHAVPNTQSREDYRGIADHRGRVVFNGKVIVAKDAQRTDAAQSSRNLLLSPHAEIDTRPELEIYANDVKCAHGATVGQLDAAALFYLQSRGIGRDEARALLIHAFAAELIERSPDATVREHVLMRFMNRMRGGTV